MMMMRRLATTVRHMSTIRVDNPYTLDTYCTVNMSNTSQAIDMVRMAAQTQMEQWQGRELAERQHVCRNWMEELEKSRDSIAKDITGQMGKPLKQAQGEINGTLDRAR